MDMVGGGEQGEVAEDPEGGLNAPHETRDDVLRMPISNWFPWGCY